MFARDGTELSPTPAFVARTESFYRRQLLARATTKQRARRAALRKQVSAGSRLDKRQRLVIDVLLLDWLIRQVNPPDANRLLGINYHLKQAVRSDDIPKALRTRIVRARLAPRRRTLSSRALVTPANGQAYRQLCQQNGVPIPPDWGTSQWIYQGDLKNPFISTLLGAEVFTFHSTSPEGLVIALPRYEVDQTTKVKTDTIDLLGIISMGKQSGNVCFWDNQTGDPANPQFNVQRGQVVPFDMFGGGTTLAFPGVGGRCTDCHAGQNPYIIHPDEPALGQLKNTLPTFASRYYEPFIPAGFPENRLPTPATVGPTSTGPCTRCHPGPGGSFPELSAAIPGYCGILETAFKGRPPGVQPKTPAVQPTMPPLDAVNPLIKPGIYIADPQPVAMLQQCRYFVSQTPPPATVPVASTFTASVTFTNPENVSWTGSHTVGLAPPPNGPQVWATPASFNGALGTPAQPIRPGDTVTRTVTVLTPIQPGDYEFALAVRNAAGKVVGRSKSTKITVTSAGPIPNAALVINSAPNSLRNGQSATVSATATNNGQTTWTPGTYIVRLTRVLRISLPQNTVAVPSGVAPGASFSFSFTIMCNGSGQGGFTAQMANQAGPFGQSVARNIVCQT